MVAHHDVVDVGERQTGLLYKGCLLSTTLECHAIQSY